MKVEYTVFSAVALSKLVSSLLIPELDNSNRLTESSISIGPSNGFISLLSQQLARVNVDLGVVPKLCPLHVNKIPEKSIPHRYIVVFKKGVKQEEVGFHKEMISSIHLQSLSKLDASHTFFIATSGKNNEFGIVSKSSEGGIQESFDVADDLKGYVGYFTDELVQFIRENPLIEFIEEDSLVFSSEFEIQNDAPWGLARISHRNKLNIGSFNKYLYDSDAGEGVTSYVIDTGINIDHVDFENRARWGKTIPSNDADYDGNGHGTHCAGIIASKTYGIAKKANVVAVKVMRSNGAGSMSDVLRGVEYVVRAHNKEASENKEGFKGSTANMSLGGAKSFALELAVDAAVGAGIHFSVAAGNENQNACLVSPASSNKAITVGASTLGDERAHFSNWGKCVDIFAPGLNILSTYIGSDTAVATLSGTSMASPHVSGLLAYFLSLQPEKGSEFYSPNNLNPSVLKAKLLEYGSKDLLANLPPQTPNRLIYNGGGGNLSEMWNNDLSYRFKKPKINPSKGFCIPKFTNRIEDTTDTLYEKIKILFDKLNLI